MGEGVGFAQIRGAVGEPPYLAGLEPIEIFRGEQVPDGLYSMLLRTVWQKGEESLTDEEVNAEAAKVVNNLSKKLNIRQRA